MNPKHQKFSRVHRPVEAAGSYYDRLAPWYDWLARSELPLILSGLEMLNLKPDESLLEIGSGTGRALQERIKSSPQVLTAGLDLSWKMLRTARKRLKHTGDSLTINLVQGSGSALPLGSNSVDTIFCSFTLELFDTPLLPQVLEEIHRTLKPDGRLVVVSLSRDQKLPPAGRIYEQFHNWFPTWIDCRPIPIRALLRESGFEIQQEDRKLMWGLPVSLVAANPE